MDDRLGRGLGAATAVGAVLAVVASVPSSWYGVPETDAYVFDPAVLSPLWIERTLLPLASVLAVALLLVGLAGLVVRDRRGAGRLRRWGGYVAVAGLALVEVTLVLFAVFEGIRAGGAGDLTGAVLVLAALLAGLVGLVLLVPGLIAAGAGYVRAGHPRVGYALIAGPVLGVLAAAVGWLASVGGAGSVPVAIPFAASFGAVAHELWTGTGAITRPVGAGADGSDEADPGERR